MMDNLLDIWFLAGLIGFLIFFLTVFIEIFQRVRGFLNAVAHPNVTVTHVVKREDSLPVIEGTARPGTPMRAEEAAGGITVKRELRKGKP